MGRQRAEGPSHKDPRRKPVYQVGDNVYQVGDHQAAHHDAPGNAR
jgi:hypothetical protein